MTTLRSGGRKVHVVGCTDSDVGGKARNLIWLAKAGARIPPTWVVCGSAPIPEPISTADFKFAVRSSFPDEDSLHSAHAGEFLTLLHVEADEIADAVDEVRGPSGDAVVIQRMIHPVLSGVVFTRDPVTGLSDVVVEAIWGRGDRLLSDGADPMRWVHRNGTFVESSETGDELADLISQVVKGAKKLGRKYGRPADLEWVWDGQDLWWVQIRPITAIESVPIYSRRISRDVMPGMIKPLVWTVNVPMVNAAWLRLITEAIGPNDIRPDQLAASYAYRSYFDMRVFGDIFERLGMPRDSLENLLGLPGDKGRMRPGLGSLVGLPRLIALAWRLRRGLDHMWVMRGQLDERFTQLLTVDLAVLSDDDLVEHIRDVEKLGMEAAYLNIVVPLQANLYTALLKRRLQRWAGVDIEDLEAHPKGVWDFGPLLAELRESLTPLPPEDLRLAVEGDLARLDAGSRELLDRFVERFGHLSESVNDISVPRWREQPSAVLRLSLDTVPHSIDGGRSRGEVEASLSLVRRVRFRRLRRSTDHMLLLREAVGSTFTLGYGLLRPAFLELGRRLQAKDTVDVPEDVFFLAQQQAIDALENHGSVRLQEHVEDVRREMEEMADLVMPDTIIGDHWIPVSGEVRDRLQGVGTSRGRHRGRARYVSALAQAASLEPGEVLIIERSDVAWTPIFSKAGAVITEAGGLLAHSSITAREMGLPCVSSVAGARRLDGEIVLVDGSTGEVFRESPAESVPAKEANRDQ